MAKLLSGTRIYGTANVDSTLYVNGVIPSTNANTGALIITAGGLGVSGNVNIGGNLSVTGNIAFQNTTINNVTVNTTDSIVTTNTTPSISTTTGSVITYGGLGIAGNTNIGGTLSVNIINLTANTNLSSNVVNLTSNTQALMDSFAVTTYRSAFYSVQISSGLQFHSINLNVIQNGTSSFITSFGSIFSTQSLGSFTTSITGGIVNIFFTPVLDISTVVFSRNAIAVLGTLVPLGSLGFVLGDPVTMAMNAGFDLDPIVTSSYSYGIVGI